jgi:hypothetical protein
VNTLVVNNADLDIPKKIAASIESIAAGVHAQGYNQVEFDSSKLQLGKTLKINGIQILNAEGETNLQGLLDRINLFTSQTQVEAKVGDRGQLVLQNTTSQGGQDLVVAAALAGETNALGVTEQTYTGLVRVTRELVDPKNSTLTIELGQNGSDAMLQPTGLKLASMAPVTPPWTEGVCLCPCKPN